MKGDILKRVLNPSTSSCTGVEIALQVGGRHVGACLFIWQMSDDVTSSSVLGACEGFERAQCIVLGRVATGSFLLHLFLLGGEQTNKQKSTTKKPQTQQNPNHFK